MSRPIQMNPQEGTSYTPTSDAMDRHEFGVSKNRKLASTGGGRAWSEDEEVYLLQTRLQKMPYKHIAAHLKKTELACRLHYHQLSHGSNRRKRTTSVSSGSSSAHSPVLPAINREPPSRDTTPPGSAGSHEPSSPDYHNHNSIQLPRIMSGNNNVSPRLPAILPKPASMTLPTTSMNSPALGYPTSTMPDSARSLGPSPFPQPSPLSGPTPSLRLDCTLPPPSAHIDMPRLQAIYAAHRSSFWGAIATDYGSGVSPIVLEQAWKANFFSGGNQTPITPAPSPNDRETPPYDKTRISAILGTDTHHRPRSPKERELVPRRFSEERRGSSSISVVAVGV